MKVLVACEFSGSLRDELRDLGHDAWSNDLEEVEPEGRYNNYHLFGDCRWFFDAQWKWDMMIAFPPCTYLTVSGARWFKGQEGIKRRELQRQAYRFFMDLVNAPIEKIAIENPVGVMSTWYRKPDQIIQPWQFGHGEVKRTCLWLKNLPLLEPTNIVEGRTPRVHYMGPSDTRQKDRSRTYKGIAKAMAEQWGKENKE